MLKVALATDLHFGVKKGSDLFLNSQLKFFREVFIPHVIKNKIKDVVWLGDTFDNRNHVSIKVMKSVIDLVEEITEHARLTVLVGNHDMFYTNRNDVHSLEMFKKNPKVRVIDRNQVVDFDGRKIFISPWVVDEPEYISQISSLPSSVKICMGHLELSGFKMFRDTVCDHGISANHFFDAFDLTLSGHFHVRNELIKDGKRITYIGNPYHLTRSDIGDDRGFCTLDIDNLELEYFNNTVSIEFKKIIYPQEVTKEMICGNVIDVYVDYDDSYSEESFQAYLKNIESLEPAQAPTVKINNVGINRIDEEVDVENLSTEELFEEFMKTQEIPNSDKVYTKLIEIFNECKREI